MQKNWTQRAATSNGYDGRGSSRHHSGPEIVNIDVLGAMLDEDLIVRLRSLEDEKERTHLDARPWEEEIAYIRREQQLRRARREAHSEYVRACELEFARSEVGLPAGDFDNSAYVYAATGGRPRWD